MWTANNWLCVLDIKNRQSDYSCIADLIHDLERLSSGETLDYGTAADISGLLITRVPNTSRETAQVVELETRLAEGDPARFSRIKSWEMLVAGLEREPSVRGFSYYIRVDTGGDGSALPDLRYLALLIQSMPEICSKLAIFFWADGISGTKTFEHYTRLSQFLRPFQMKYGVFYAHYGDLVKKLTTNPEIPKGFLPLLEIDASTYPIIRQQWKLSALYNGESFDKLFTTIHPEGTQDREVTMLFQIGARMFFRALDGRKYGSTSRKRQLLTLLCETVLNAGGISALDMILFGALMDRELYKNLSSTELAEYTDSTQALSKALAQILENIVYHSEHKKGVFTIRIQTERGYIQKNYPDYQIGEQEYGLELLIADSNRQDGIVRNFLSKGKATPDLRALAGKVTLADFFQKKPESPAAQAWTAARAKSPELCHGLLAFAGTAKRFNGAVSVRSSPSSTGTNEETYFYYDYDRKMKSDFAAHRHWMPGTQFSVIFRRRAFRWDVRQKNRKPVKSVFHDAHIIYGTTYRTLAWALEYGCHMKPLFSKEVGSTELAKRFEVDSPMADAQTQKDETVQKWKRWFNDKAAYGREQATGTPRCALFDADLADFSNQSVAVWETFCKGFLSSDFFVKSDGNIRYGILLRNMSTALGETFYQTLLVLSEHIYTEATCVYFYQEHEEGGAARYIGATLHESLRLIGLKNAEMPDCFPQVLPYSLLVKDGDETLFEREVIRRAQISILSRDEQGYQVEDTHMRLGNKVHLDSFFEMSLFFESPNYAYYTAFLLLERLKNAGLDNYHRILFYGYTSYSRGIVWAAMRIWREYMVRYSDAGRAENVEMEFVIYQNDLKLESASPSVQMYYSKKEWLQNPKSIWSDKETGMALVQIVPISSSLNTFNKMLSKLNSETDRHFKPMTNLTAFWVRDDFRQKWLEKGAPGPLNEELPTDEEKHFWKQVALETRTVTRGPAHDANEVPVQFLVSVTSYWRHPLSCKKCFPADPLLEYPLVETDPTSTVPTQQFYPKVSGSTGNAVNKEQKAINDMRISGLRGNMLYGHISRGHNHFQYYIQSRQYFQQERDEISRWLSGLSSGGDRNSIDVLVVPKQTSNVEFSQFVYEYYFKGEAESIIVNTEKEFRSNFLAEYNGLRQRLVREKVEDRQVHFHYVDMTISSGTTFNRAAALVRSLFNRKEGDTENSQGRDRDAFPFESVFLLISRMSEDSKRTFVKDPATQFHAYAELNISNIRTYGDSCVPCKLQQEAALHYRNAATKSVSEYWEKKSIRRANVQFDQCRPENWMQGNQLPDHGKGYRRMACTHLATAYIKQARGKEAADYFDALRLFFTELLGGVEGSADVSPIFNGASKERLGWLSAGLKVVVRPFFSFDYKLRCATTDLYLLLVHYLLNHNGRQPDIGILMEEGKPHLNLDTLDWVRGFANTLSGILEEELCGPGGKGIQEEKGLSEGWNMPYRRLRFIQSHILKGLTDLKSNYILRRDTMLLLCRCLARTKANRAEQDDFFNHYLRSILRLMHTSSDETKSVWLEYLLQFQAEYIPGEGIPTGKYGGSMKKYLLENCKEVYPAFRRFFDLLLVENNRPLYQGVRELVHDPADGQFDNTRSKRALEEYYMHNVCQFVNLGAKKGMSTDSGCAEKELLVLCELYMLLHPAERASSELSLKDPLARYDSLRKVLSKIVFDPTTKAPEEQQVLLFGEHNRIKKRKGTYLKSMPPYYLISPRPAVDYTGQTESDVVLDRLAVQLKEDGLKEELEKTGYLLLKRAEIREQAEDDNEDGLYDAILALDNNFDAIHETDRKDYTIQKIEPVYIFLPCGAERMKTLMVVRKILMFRCRLIAWLEQDFNNHAIAYLSRQRYWAETLAADKVGDHAERGFIECMQRVMTDEGDWDGTDRFIAGKDGRPVMALKSKRHNTSSENNNAEYLTRSRRWYFLCAYVNSRISRLYRTYAREANHREYTGEMDDSVDQLKKLYDRNHQDIGMRPAYDLGTVFFTQIDAGKRRKNYIAQMMQVIIFCIDGQDDTACGDEEPDRLALMEKSLRSYKCIQFDKDNNHYAYLSEYLAAIFLDCCISAIKAGKDWNDTRWGDLAFSALCEKAPADKCRVKLYREQGFPLPASLPAFDYLVIENEVYMKRDRQNEQGPGMSQKAICWYIDKLWQTVFKEDGDYPKVEFVPPNQSGEPYRIKLPILKREKELNL